MRFLVFVTIFLTVLVQKNKAELAISDDKMQEIIRELLLIVYGTARFENVTCLPVSSDLVKFYLYTPKNKQEAVLLTEGNVTELSLFDASLETKIMTHGWTDSSGSWSTSAKNKYLEVGDYNIILLDWSWYATNLYSKCVCYAKKVAEMAASLLVQLRDEANLDFKKTHVIGHSIGGQIAGLIGQNVQKLTGGEKLGRVTGLDSAGPMFCHPILANDDERITADDADFVDAIHTSNSDLGCDVSYGKANFFPNCGKLQAGCTLGGNLTIANITGSVKDIIHLESCSHSRAHSYWIESINSDDFISAPCDICTTNEPTSCEKSSSEIMGEHASPLATGNFYLTTNPSSPYAEKNDNVLDVKFAT